MQLIHAQHQAVTLARTTGTPIAVVVDGLDYLPVSLDECDNTNKEPHFIAYPNGKTEVIH